MSQENFSELSLDEKVAIIDERLGHQPDRISNPKDLLSLYGKTIYFVVSPFGDEEQIGNGTILSWDVGKVCKHTGELITEESEITLDNNEKYICFDHTNIENGVSLKDFNIIPNTYNNHAAFSSKNAAEAYVVYRKLQWSEDSNIKSLEGDYAHWFTVSDIERLNEAESKLNKDDT